MKALFLISMIVCCIVLPGKCQEHFPYNFSAFRREYIPLEYSTLITTEPGWDTLDFTVHFPFDFYYMGSLVDSMSVINYSADFLMSNGYLFLPYHVFIRDRNITDSTGYSYIKYNVTQGPEGKILTLQYENIGYFDNIFGAYFGPPVVGNFQLKFYENTNVLEICFGYSALWIVITNFSYGFPIILAGPVDPAGSMQFESSYYLTGDPFDPQVAYGDSTALYFTPGQPQLHTFLHFPHDDSSMQDLVYHFSPKENPTAIFSNPPKQQLQIYPNPASDAIYVKPEELYGTPIEIFNLQGQKVFSAPAAVFLKIQLSAYPAGVYVLKQGPLVRRFVKL